MTAAESTWCLLQVRVVVPYQGPCSDSVVVRMIPDSRLPPRHLHAVHTGKTSAVVKWESPYDSPDQDLVSAQWPWSPGYSKSDVGARVRAKTLVLGQHRRSRDGVSAGASFLFHQGWELLQVPLLGCHLPSLPAGILADPCRPVQAVSWF